MGHHDVERGEDEILGRNFMRAILTDLRALEWMLDHDYFGEDVCRIGAEQEMFLVDRTMRPSPISREVLEQVEDPRLTTEIARFNLEANLTPQILAGDCFSRIEQETHELVSLVRSAARNFDSDVVLCGILPTLRLWDLNLSNLTDNPRYHELNRTIMNLRGGELNIHIKGLDELTLRHDNVMTEACNTSFQVQMQLDHRRYAELYNLAQLITAPLLACAVNSPVLFGRRLWSETRLALFQHSVDARSRVHLARQTPTRVTFGDAWLKDSVLEIFREDVSRFRVIMKVPVFEDSIETLKSGGLPELVALRLHNGTVWRWNRPCYGTLDGETTLEDRESGVAERSNHY